MSDGNTRRCEDHVSTPWLERTVMDELSRMGSKIESIQGDIERILRQQGDTHEVIVELATHLGVNCCSHCRISLDTVEVGPMLINSLWATIAKPQEYLCFDCVEDRLGRPLTQRDLIICPFNAGWLPYATTDPAAAGFATGRTLLP